MEKEELKNKIFEVLEKHKGKKRLKEKDIMNIVNKETGVDKDTIRKAIREMIEIGRLMYSYTGGASTVEIPDEAYLREKGLLKD
jgi:hypothetical protein